MQKTLTEMYTQGMKQNRQKFIEEALGICGRGVRGVKGVRFHGGAFRRHEQAP